VAKKIRVLIVDDSALVREMLTDMLSQSDEIVVVGVAADAYIARDKIKKLSPDVLTLDVEMPRMDGISFLRNLMRLRPMPVVMISSLTEKGAETTLQALELGAVDFVSKPKADLARSLGNYAEEIIEKVKMAATASVRALERNISVAKKKPISAVTETSSNVVPPRYSTDAVLSLDAVQSVLSGKQSRIIAIGASTGGTEAIKEILMEMPADSPPIVIAQHIPKAFSGPFAQRMDTCSALTVFEAKDGQPILPGQVFIAPGDKHLLLAHDGSRYVCKLDAGKPVNRHKPAVDVLFRSVSLIAGKNAVGVLLTGMGADGAAGLKEMQASGAATIAQNERTSVVWGMPGEAVKLGAADEVLPLDYIASAILSTH